MSELDPSADASATSLCGSNEYNGRLGLRVAAIFVILLTSAFGTLFPIVSRRLRAITMPERIYEGVKYFGSGVIIATAFIHLLAPAFEELNAPCLTGTWQNYPFAPAIAMLSVFLIFIAELVTHRAGASYLRKHKLQSHDPHTQGTNDHSHTIHGAHIEENNAGLASQADNDYSGDSIANQPLDEENSISRTESTATESPQSLSGKSDVESHAAPAAPPPPSHHHHDEIDEQGMAQIIGVVILEAGVILHSFIIGLTLAVDARFVPLFIVLVFHQMFEGLGLGSRLSVMPLPKRYSWVPYAGAVLYSCITPLGIAIGLGVRTRYNPDSAIASIVSGVLDALAAGILLYTGLVELLAHDFIFNRAMAVEASNAKVTYSVSCVLLGAGIMALLGRWA